MDRRQWRTTGKFLIASGVVLLLLGGGLLWMAPLEASRPVPTGTEEAAPDDPYADAGQVVALIGIVLITGGIIPASTQRRLAERPGAR